jgi:hypothetical protein
VAEEAGDGLEQGRTEWLFVEACPPLLTLLHHPVATSIMNLLN